MANITEDIGFIKETIKSILYDTKRDGIDKLFEFLDVGSDYFQAPSSMNHHLNIEGGLAIHSFNVYTCAIRLNTIFDLKVSKEKIAITALLHDLCKTNTYEREFEPASQAQMNYLRSLSKSDWSQYDRSISKQWASDLIGWYKDGKKGDKPPEIKESWRWIDDSGLDHGVKSVLLIQRFIPLYDDEILAIRYHMFPFEAMEHDRLVEVARAKSKLVTLLSIADQSAAFLLET